MQKFLYISVLLLIGVKSSGQYFGMDSININGNLRAVILVPGAGKYGLLMECGDQTENLSNSPQGLSAIFNSGTPKLIKNGISIYPIKPGGGADSFIVVKWQPANYNDYINGSDLASIYAYLVTNYGAHIDSSKYSDGTYKFIGYASCERGADPIFGGITWQVSTGGGSDPSAFFNKIKKVFTSRMQDVHSIGSLAPAAYSGSNHRVLKYFHKSGEFTQEQQIHDSIAKYSTQCYQVFKTYSFTNSALYDTMYSPFGGDSSRNIYRNLMDDTGTKPAPVFMVHVKNTLELTASYSQGDVGKIKYASDTSGYGGSATGPNPIADSLTFGNPAGLKHIFPTKQFDFYYDLTYPGRRGLRVLFDLTGAIDETDTTNRFNLNSFWGYGSGASDGDTLWVYSVDTMFTRPVNDRVKFIARPDSLATLLGYLITVGGSQAWQSFNTTARCRYLLLRTNLMDHGGVFASSPDYLKIIIYANNNPTIPTQLPQSYTGPYPAHTTFAKGVGTNIPQGFATTQLGADVQIRGYGSIDGWDTTNAPFIKKLAAEVTFPDINYHWYDSLHTLGKKMVWAIRGSNKWAQGQHGGGFDWGTDFWTPTTDPEDLLNYKRADTLFFNYAAKLGKVAIDTNLTKWSTNTPANGLNLEDGVENDNEPDIHSVSPIAYWCRSMMEYDGYESRYGRGTFGADPNFGFYQGATSNMDTNWNKVIIWLSRVARTDKKIVWTTFNFHAYPRTLDTLDHVATCEELVGSTSEAPEKDSIVYHFKQMSNVIYNWLHGDTSHHITQTEYGYGNWGTPSNSPTQACNDPWDAGNTPSVGGVDSMTMKAYMQARYEMLQNFTPIYSSNEFFFTNSSFGPNDQRQFSSYGRSTGRDVVNFKSTVFFPYWYYRAGLVTLLGNYVPDHLVSSTVLGLYVAKYRNVAHPDSVCYAVWKGSRTATTLSSQTVAVGALKSNTVTTGQPLTTSITPTIGSATVSGGVLTIGTVSENPQFFFMQELPISTNWIFKHKAVFKSN